MIWWSLQQLKSKDPKSRLQAVKKLAEEDDEKVLPHLIQSVSDPDPDVRRAAVLALQGFPVDQTFQTLFIAMNDGEAVVREAAVLTLQKGGHPQALGAIFNGLKDESSAVRWHAGRALKDAGWEPADDAQQAYLAVALGEIDRAAIYGPPAVEAISLMLKTGAYYQRQAAIVALSQIADARVVKSLLTALRDADEQVRGAAIEALRKIGDQRAVDPLIRALKDSHYRVRMEAAETLGVLGDARAAEGLTRILRDPHWEVRQAATLALGKLNVKEAVPALVGVLKDRDREVREAAIKALDYIRSPDSISGLVMAMADDQDVIRQLATNTLQNIDPNWQMSEAAHSVIPELKTLLKSREYWVRQASAEVLARIGNIRPAEPATKGLAEPTHYRREAAIDALTEMVRDYDRDLRHAAVDALGRLGLPASARVLRGVLEDEDEGVRAAAQRALEIIQGKPGTGTPLALHGGLFPT